MSIFEHIPFTAPYKYKRDPEFRDSERMAYLKDREYFDNYSGYPDYLNKIRKDISDHEAMFDSRVQEELTKAYKLYENGEMTNDEFKYIEASLDELKKNKESLISRNATFGFAPTTDEGVAKGQPRYKLMVMQDKNPFTKDLPQGNTLKTGDFR